MRIVGGKYAGRDLTSPRDWRVRPTAEHVRAALLDLLAADVAGARVLDLYAGTGALGSRRCRAARGTPTSSSSGRRVSPRSGATSRASSCASARACGCATRSRSRATSRRTATTWRSSTRRTSRGSSTG
jgi:hypothetical protein